MDETKAVNFPASETPTADSVWVLGKDKEWYVARWIWNEADAQRWHSKGYEVQRSTEIPSGKQMTIAEVYGEIEIK